MGAIYLIRHAQASFGATDYDQLSDVGSIQSRVLGESLLIRGPRTDRIVCGTMRRHEQTAEGCLRAMGLAANWASDPGWNEYDAKDVMGAYDARYRDATAMAAELAASDNPRRRFQEIFALAMDRWVSGAHDSDYAESWPAFRTRVGDALGRVSASLAKSQGALVFTSGGPIAVACAALLNLSAQDALRLNTRLANAAITKLLWSGQTIHLSTINEHGHFERGSTGSVASASSEGALITYR
jgi:broad specificity phosphatase PhoE